MAKHTFYPGAIRPNPAAPLLSCMRDYAHPGGARSLLFANRRLVPANTAVVRFEYFGEDLGLIGCLRHDFSPVIAARTICGHDALRDIEALYAQFTGASFIGEYVERIWPTPFGERQ